MRSWLLNWYVRYILWMDYESYQDLKPGDRAWLIVAVHTATKGKPYYGRVVCGRLYLEALE